MLNWKRWERLSSGMMAVKYVDVEKKLGFVGRVTDEIELTETPQDDRGLDRHSHALLFSHT